jgi:hypothetical protein
VHNALWHDEALIGQKLNRAALDVDHEFSAQHEEELIVVIVLVPVVFALHYAKAHDGVIYLAECLIIICPKADIECNSGNVRFVPLAEVAYLRP